MFVAALLLFFVVVVSNFHKFGGICPSSKYTEYNENIKNIMIRYRLSLRFNRKM